MLERDRGVEVPAFNVEHDPEHHAMYIRFGDRIPGSGHRYSMSARVDLANTHLGLFDDWDTPEDVYGVLLQNLSQGTMIDILKLPLEYEAVVETEVQKRGYTVLRDIPDDQRPAHLRALSYIPDEVTHEESEEQVRIQRSDNPHKTKIPVYAVNDAFFMYEEPRLPNGKNVSD